MRIDYDSLRTANAIPCAASMIETFRAIGYNIETAVADIIDNSISELEPTDSISIIKHLTALFYLSSYDNAIKANIGDKWKDKLIALLSSSELRKLFKYNILKDKQEGASRVFIAIDEKLYAFYNIRLGNKLVKQLLPDKIFLNKDDYHDPLKNIEELLFSL